MKIYTVHVRPDERQVPVFVKEGFNIWAFLFTGLWTLYQRLWIPTAIIVMINIALATLMKEHILSEFGAVAVQIGFNFLIGFHANDWLRTRLQKTGYILADVAAADTLLRAEQRYFERSLAAT